MSNLEPEVIEAEWVGAVGFDATAPGQLAKASNDQIATVCDEIYESLPPEKQTQKSFQKILSIAASEDFSKLADLAFDVKAINITINNTYNHYAENHYHQGDDMATAALLYEMEALRNQFATYQSHQRPPEPLLPTINVNNFLNNSSSASASSRAESSSDSEGGGNIFGFIAVAFACVLLVAMAGASGD